MANGTTLTLGTVWLACIGYVVAVAAWLMRRPGAARIAWTAGLICYLGHVAAAFAFYHGWNHSAAYEETARQTAELFGVRWGGGLYFNYLFTAVWTVDVLWIWWNTAAYRKRPTWIAALVHGFLAFMFFNGTVVFGSGWVRWFGVAMAAGLGLLALRRRSVKGKSTH